MSTSAWIFKPRDPLVFGDGSQQPALLARPSHPWPLPSMTTAQVRSTLALDPAWLRGHGLPAPSGGQVPSDVSTRLLSDVRVRGPWLLRGDARPPALADIWAAAPADASVVQGELTRGRLIRPPAGAGALPPRGASPTLLLERPHKGEEPPFPLWPLDALLSWALQDRALGEIPAERPIVEESRVHVSLDDQTGTAAPEQLFTSAGLRWREGWAIGLEVITSAPISPATGVEVLGGESRVGFRATHPGELFPAMPKERYDAALKGLEGKGEILLRLQLLTPGCFGDWLPPALGDLEGCTLVAACVPRAQAISGWNAQLRAPRAVRRLVPAGSVYWYRVPSGTSLSSLAGRLWGSNLPGANPDGESSLAAPHLDGFNQVLPGFTLAP